MKFKSYFALFFSLLMVCSFGMHAVSTSAIISYSISHVDSISITGGNSGSPSSFDFCSAAAGCDIDAITDATTIMHITTNSGSNRTISCQLGYPLPKDARLTVNVAAGSSGGTSAGPIDMSDGDLYNVVTGIEQTMANDMTITYNFKVCTDTPITNLTNVFVTYTMQ